MLAPTSLSHKDATQKPFLCCNQTLLASTNSNRRMRSRSDSVFAPLPLQDSASPDLDLSSIAHIPPTPDSPPYQIRKSSPRRNSQLGTPSKSSRRRSRTVSQGDRGGRNLPTPTHSSDSEEGGREGIVLYGRDTQNSVMVEIGQEENQKSRRGSSSTRMSEGEGDYLVGGRDRDGGAGTADEDQDPMLQQIARERQLVWEQTRSRNLGRKKWLILVVSPVFDRCHGVQLITC